MKLKLWVSCLAVVSLVAVSASAQESAPKVDVFAGYSYLQANPVVTGVDSFHLHGGNASAAYNITDRKSTRLNSSHLGISYAVFCLKKKKTKTHTDNKPET